MMRRLVSVLVAAIVAGCGSVATRRARRVGGPATAGGRLALVAGEDTYELNEGISHVQLYAFAGPDGVRGTFAFHGSFVNLTGSVTCVTLRGADASVAGVIDNADEVGLDGWMIRVKDHGIRDRAATFMDDYGLALDW